jgi:hypothetical protein
VYGLLARAWGVRYLDAEEFAAQFAVGQRPVRGGIVTAALATSPTATILATFTYYYDVNQYIPANIRVPCSGTGRVGFVPLPTSPTARTATLAVTFVNVAA